MPLMRLCLLLALPVWLAAAELSAAAAASSDNGRAIEGYQPYTVQPGDTITSIARKYGLAPDAVAKANALDKPHRIMVGNVLRLPVTPPDTLSAGPGAKTPEATPETTAAAPAPSPEPAPLPKAAPAKNDAPAAPPAAASKPAAGQAVAPGKTDAPAARTPPAPPAPLPQTPPAAKAPEPAETPAAESSPARLAVGVYTHPVLGTLRISQTPTGISVVRDNQTIAMRHLLYGVFDGSDNAGLIHGLRLEFDAAGQVAAVLYNSGGTKDVTFTRARK